MKKLLVVINEEIVPATDYHKDSIKELYGKPLEIIVDNHGYSINDKVHNTQYNKYLLDTEDNFLVKGEYHIIMEKPYE